MEMLLFTAIRQHAQHSPERIALQDAQHSLTYAQLWQRIQLRAAELQAFNQLAQWACSTV